jgi:DNA-binding ferritin-like protein (Dps family)
MEKEITFIKSEGLKNALEGTKFMKHGAFYTYFNDYIFTFGYEGGKINVRSIFSNPLELLELTNCDGKPCAEDVFIEDDMKRTIKIMIMDEFNRIKNKVEAKEVEINSSKQ